MKSSDYMRAGLLFLGIYLCYVLLKPANLEHVEHDTTPPVPTDPAVELETVRSRAIQWANWHANKTVMNGETRASCIDTGHRVWIPCTVSLYGAYSANHLYGIKCYRDLPTSVPGSCTMTGPDL